LGRDITVTKLNGSFDRNQQTFLAKSTYKVSIVDGGNRTVFHVRLTEASMELIADPEKFIKESFATQPLPEAGAVVDMLLIPRKPAMPAD
jgi:hypothetical protein